MNDDEKKQLDELNLDGLDNKSNYKRKRKSKNKNKNKEHTFEDSMFSEDDSAPQSSNDLSNDQACDDNKKSCKGFFFLFLLLLGTWGFLGYEKYLEKNNPVTADSKIVQSEANKDELNSLNDKIKALIEENKSEINILSDKNNVLSQKIEGLYSKTKQLKSQYDYLNNQYESLSNKFQRNLSQQIIQQKNLQAKLLPAANKQANISSQLFKQNDNNIKIIKSLNDKNDELLRQRQLSDNELEQLKKKTSEQSTIIELKDIVISSVGLKNDFHDKSKIEQYLSSLSQNTLHKQSHSISDEVQHLEKYAINALIDGDYLTQEFDKLLNDINLRKLELNKDKSLTDKILYKTSKFVKVTKSGDSKASHDIDAKLSIAKKYVEDSEFHLAYNQIKDLGSDYNKILSNWADDVEIYVNAHKALDKIISKLNSNIKNIQMES